MPQRILSAFCASAVVPEVARETTETGFAEGSRRGEPRHAFGA